MYCAAYLILFYTDNKKTLPESEDTIRYPFLWQSAFFSTFKHSIVFDVFEDLCITYQPVLNASVVIPEESTVQVAV